MIFPKLHKPGGTPDAIPVQGHIPAQVPEPRIHLSPASAAGARTQATGWRLTGLRLRTPGELVHFSLESSSAENQRATPSSPPWKMFQRHWETSSDH